MKNVLRIYSTTKNLTFLPNNLPKNKGVDSLMYAKLSMNIANITNLFMMK